MRFNRVAIGKLQDDSTSFSVPGALKSKSIRFWIYSNEYVLSDMLYQIIGAFQNSHQEVANLGFL